MTTRVLLLNDDGFANLDGGRWGSALGPARQSEIVSNIGSDCRELYIGSEAFRDLPALKEVLQFCNIQRIQPHLLSWGQCFENYEIAQGIISELRKITPLTIISVGDQYSWPSVDLYRFDQWLRAVKAAGISAELLFLARDDCPLPKSLLSMRQINTECSIYPRKADGLGNFFELKGWRIVTRETGEAISNDKSIQRANDTDYIVEGPDCSPVAPPIFFNALVLETTHFCNAKCDHCYTSCGPEVSKRRLDVETLRRVISEAAQMPNLLRRCHVGGGEATIYWNEMLAVLDHAKNEGFLNSIVTNGWWAKNKIIAERKVVQLREAGVSNIELSVDAMHQEYISTESIDNLIQAAEEAQVKVTLRVCTTESRRADVVLKDIRTNVRAGLTIATSRVTAVGRAKDAIPTSDLFLEDGVPPGTCNSVLNLTITPNGDVFPCCAGSEVCSSLKLGNINEKSLGEIGGQSLRGNSFVRTLVHAGPAYFAALLNEAGVTKWMKPRYGNICQLCTDICSDDDLSNLIQQKLGDQIRAAFPIAMRTLSL